MSRCDEPQATHHLGCDCHEAHHRAEIARLIAQRDALAADFSKMHDLVGDFMKSTAVGGPQPPEVFTLHRFWCQVLGSDSTRAVTRAQLVAAVVEAAREANREALDAERWKALSAAIAELDAHDKQEVTK